MRYYGGKYRIRKDLWKILNKEAEGRVFVDLFCGACNNDNNPKIQFHEKAQQKYYKKWSNRAAF